LNDLRSDSDIAVSGAAYEQIVALANWWKRASSLAGTTVQQFRLQRYVGDRAPSGTILVRSEATSVVVLEDASPASATSEVRQGLSADGDRKADLVGHSLGGHLAMAFSALFAG